MKKIVKINEKLSLLYFLVLFSSSFYVVSINLGFTIRIGQLMILFMFGIILLLDLKNKSANEFILLFFIFFALFLTFISKNSVYAKIGEIKFIIKYLIIFPATFYLAQWTVRNFKVKTFIEIMEITLYCYIFMAFLLYFYPIQGLYNDRGAITGFQGTFLEAGWYALAIGSFTLTSILVRLDYNLKFSKYQYFLYFLAFLSMVLSKNKTVWLGILAILIFVTLFKSIITNKKHIKNSVKNIKNINSVYFIGIIIIFIMLFFVANTVLPEPIVTIEMLEEKLNEERGKAYFAAIKLLENSDWLGGYGFGFVQQYFSVYTDEIMGLNEDTGMFFNSFLDIWVSVGPIGILFHLILLYISIDRSHLVTLTIPIYWFISANTNPTIIDEYYYLFLGISYGFILKDKERLNTKCKE